MVLTLACNMPPPMALFAYRRCPGRAFAEMEIALFAATVLLHFDLQLAPQPPAQTGAAAEPWWQRMLFPAAALQVWVVRITYLASHAVIWLWFRRSSPKGTPSFESATRTLHHATVRKA